MTSLKERGIIALDGMSAEKAFDMAKHLSGHVWGFKVNDVLDGDYSPENVIKELSRYGSIFADIKAHDIPNTVANRVAKYAKHGAHLITVHASGGGDMIAAAVKAYEDNKPENGLGILPVTVLTSMDDQNCFDSYGDTVENTVLRFAEFAKNAGAYGIVCSAMELPLLRKPFAGMKFVVPGTRSIGVKKDDQARVKTPAEAIEGGADFLVIGREVTKAENPLAAIAGIDATLAAI